MTTEATPGNVPLNDQLGPVAEVKCGRLQWAIPRDDYRLPLRFLNNDTHPLYDQAALDAAVAAERERCAVICEGMGAMEALEGEEEGSAAMVRVADRMADLCAAAIRKA